MDAPRSGNLYYRPENDEIYALIITVERETLDGWMCYAVLMYPGGGLSAPQMVEILPSDVCKCQNLPMSYGTQLAFIRQMQIKGALS